MTEDFKRKLTAILSADVVGYSRLMGEDEAATVKTLEIYKGVMSSLIKQHRGRVIDSPGDNLLAEFGSVVDAVQCAVSIQKELQTRNADLAENRRMELRIGINLGDVIEEEDRIYGDGVNIAARLEALADPGGICISKTAFDHIENKLPLGYEFLGEQTVKNITKPVGAYRVLMEPRVTSVKEVEEKKAIPFWRKKAVLSLGIIVILAMLGTLYWNFYLRGPSIKSTSIEPEQETIVPDAKEAPKSIAVLPFKNLSPEKDQEYFADGLTEELLNKLSQVKDLEVTARTSSFYFKGRNEDMRTIGEKLGVTYLLEGSVRKSGNQLRVTSQLIKAVDGYHLWSETYERELKDVFTIQDEIAEAVTTALSITLGAGWFNKPGGTRNVKAWDKYLQCASSFSKMTPDPVLAAIDQCEQASRLDPEFVWPLILQWSSYYMAKVFLPPAHTSGFQEKAASVLEQARSITPDNPAVLRTVARDYINNGNWLAADRIYLSLIEEYGHADIGVNMGYSVLLTTTGHCNEALQVLQRAKRIDPLSANVSSQLIFALVLTGRLEEAIAESRRGQKLGGFQTTFQSVEIMASLMKGDRILAADLIDDFNIEYSDKSFLRIPQLLREGDDAALLTEIQELGRDATQSQAVKNSICFLAAWLGQPRLALNMAEGQELALLWAPVFSEMRQLQGFKEMVRETGLVNYWRKTGKWPDLCRPLGDDDFECD